MKKFKNSTLSKFENRHVLKLNSIFGGESFADRASTAKNQTREFIMDKDSSPEYESETK